MSRAGFVLFGLIALLLALFPEACVAKQLQQCTHSCGNIHNIDNPFRLKGDPPECGDRNFELGCENNRSTLSLYSGKYYVQDISHDRMRVIDAGLDNDSCSFPRSILSLQNFSNLNPYGLALENVAIVFMNCGKPVNSSRYIDASPCISSSSSPKTYFYALYGDRSVSDINEACRVQFVAPALFSNITSLSIFDIHNKLLMGFELLYWWSPHQKTSSMERLKTWLQDVHNEFQGFWKALWYFLFSFPGYKRMIGDLYSDSFNTTGWFASLLIKGFILERTLLGILFLITFSICMFRRRHLSDDYIIEKFLQSHNTLMPIRYSYSEIKEMTRGFKDKLGQGGYGSVYKGKSRSGHVIAVKVLGTSKANGQDFINEVATMGRIYHVNVVRLIGFCVEGSKRALIYDFMANGSLDKFIFRKGEKINPLSWEKMYEIGLGVARGIGYLHRGCDMQILHFDIKPHNILLDENFIPKISDFGLAKFYPVNESIVSLSAARGTLGYIAPELFYKNIGGVSYKADVYSFGMLLMEMVGKQKKVNEFAEQSSQIYFPSWVYDRITQGEDIGLGNASEGENRIARKMIIVALWCTQMKPVDRPSMSKVLEMLEGNIELLQMPPKPLLCPQEMSVENHAGNIPRGAPVLSYNDIGTITLDVR